MLKVYRKRRVELIKIIALLCGSLRHSGFSFATLKWFQQHAGAVLGSRWESGTALATVSAEYTFTCHCPSQGWEGERDTMTRKVRRPARVGPAKCRV
jgi:hypothetical protein